MACRSRAGRSQHGDHRAGAAAGLGDAALGRGRRTRGCPLVPLVSGAPWLDVGRQLGQVPPAALGLLTVVWAVGLLLHTIALTGGLPGLTHRRALTLSLTGSAVANVLPLGARPASP